MEAGFLLPEGTLVRTFFYRSDVAEYHPHLLLHLDKASAVYAARFCSEGLRFLVLRFEISPI